MIYLPENKIITPFNDLLVNPKPRGLMAQRGMMAASLDLGGVKFVEWYVGEVVGSPTKTLTCELYTGTPSGTDLTGGGTLIATTNGVAESSISVGWVQWEFTTPQVITSTSYILLKRSATDDTNHINLHAESGDNDAASISYNILGAGSWTAPSTDYFYKLKDKDGVVLQEYDGTFNQNLELNGDTSSNYRRAAIGGLTNIA